MMIPEPRDTNYAIGGAGWSWLAILRHRAYTRLSCPASQRPWDSMRQRSCTKTPYRTTFSDPLHENGLSQDDFRDTLSIIKLQFHECVYFGNNMHIHTIIVALLINVLGKDLTISPFHAARAEIPFDRALSCRRTRHLPSLAALTLWETLSRPRRQSGQGRRSRADTNSCCRPRCYMPQEEPWPGIR